MSGSVFVGTSLDGFIARADGALDFLPPGGGEPHGDDEFIATVDAVVSGRNSSASRRVRTGPSSIHGFSASRSVSCSTFARPCSPAAVARPCSSSHPRARRPAADSAHTSSLQCR